MATVLPERTQNPYGQAFSGMMNMKLMQSNWNKFLDSYQGQQQAGALQTNPESGIGMGVGPGMAQNQPATMGNLQQSFPQQRSNPLAAMGQGIGRGMQGIGQGMSRMGQGIGGMLGMNQQQPSSLMGAPGMMRQGGMSNLAQMPTGMGSASMGMNPMLIQMMIERMGRTGGY